jgi:uncharacterized phage protein gp47/JayE
MPFARPTLTGLRNTSIEDITTSGVPGLTGLLRMAVLRVLAWVMAGLAYSIYGYADWIARMGVPFTAEDEYLYAWAGLIGVYPLDATAATGNAAFTGSPDLVVPNGTGLTRQDGTPYETTADGTVDSSGNVTVPMIALVAGAFTNCDDGTPISISLPIASINSGGVTVGPTVGGADQETNDALRTRMLAKYAAPPQGGASTDYQNWALEVPGCTRAWVAPQGYGPGSVVVYPMFDGSEAAHGGFPQGTDGCAAEETRGPTAAGDQSLVAEHIWPVQPVTALVYVAAPLPYPIDVTLMALDPADEATQTTILAALNDMFLVRGEIAGVIYPSDIYDAILAVPGIQHFVVSAPESALQAGPGQLPIMGTLSVVAA